ncbi:Phosphatidylinositol 3 [Phytophthora cinnamomi]|uniref:Phosphatidylinositol 3 n=1 Tax=Phytophthora cinnamomi TaxID=4785 RepID=UPI00355A0197|nr:Phosphatidylinositol 3 [Phytophthora cinnamomi]
MGLFKLWTTDSGTFRSSSSAASLPWPPARPAAICCTTRTCCFESKRNSSITTRARTARTGARVFRFANIHRNAIKIASVRPAFAKEENKSVSR